MATPYARPTPDPESDYWPVSDTTLPQLRAAAKAWRANGLPQNIHDRIDDLINEIERMRKGARYKEG